MHAAANEQGNEEYIYRMFHKPDVAERTASPAKVVPNNLCSSVHFVSALSRSVNPKWSSIYSAEHVYMMGQLVFMQHGFPRVAGCSTNKQTQARLQGHVRTIFSPTWTRISSH